MKASIFDGSTKRTYSPDDAVVLSKQTPYVWVDVVTDKTKDPDVMELLDHMGLTQVVAAYTTRAFASGMFEVFGETVLGSAYAAADDEAGPPVLIHCVWNAGCFITIRAGADKAVGTALRELTPRSKALFAAPSIVPGVLMQLLLDSIERRLTRLQTKIALLDDQIIIKAEPAQMAQLRDLRKPVESLGTRIPPYGENVRESLVAPDALPGMDAAGIQALKTYSACVGDVAQRIDTAASDVRSAIQDYQGQVSTAQGNRINQLTLVSTIFLPISFLTGYFGMNFQYLVNSTMSMASWLVLGVLLPIVSVAVSVALLRKGGFHIGELWTPWKQPRRVEPHTEKRVSAG